MATLALCPEGPSMGDLEVQLWYAGPATRGFRGTD